MFDSLPSRSETNAISRPSGDHSGAQQLNAPASSVDVGTVGPRVGDALPEFSLHDQSGHMRSLKSPLGANGAVIVFFRSADW